MDNKFDMYPVIEAVLFAAGYPVPYERLSELCEAEEALVREVVSDLSDKYKAGEFGIQILLFDEACQMCTKETYESYVRDALGLKQGGKLSNSSLEVLAIVAYHQPVTRSQIEKIRGVDSSYAVSSLTMKKLIEEKGRLDVPGRPVLFGTTADFLRCFGLTSLDDLPDASTFLDETQTSFDEEILNSGGEAPEEKPAESEA
ncbi:MAG: SMC-Scp complex subunit ScpB [Clostridia bacterium]|nr:SMC-Scp complex subunit ScpB [Clostridia bacterium]